jgi:hypothetical protein
MSTLKLKPAGSVFYLYFDGGYYHDTLLFGLATKPEAESVAKKINDSWAEFDKKLPKLPRDVDHPDFDRLYDIREAMLAKRRWPFGVDMVNQECVLVGELPMRAIK